VIVIHGQVNYMMVTTSYLFLDGMILMLYMVNTLSLNEFRYTSGADRMVA